jgi:hypothetical protein
VPAFAVQQNIQAALRPGGFDHLADDAAVRLLFTLHLVQQLDGFLVIKLAGFGLVARFGCVFFGLHAAQRGVRPSLPL